MMPAAFLALLMMGATDSIPQLQRCGNVKVPLGIADTGSIAIIDVLHGTPSGLRSALERQLPGCRFRPASHERRNVAKRIAARVHFVIDKMHTEILAAAPEESSTDERLEELPRRLACQLVSREEIVTKVRVNGRVMDNPVAMPSPGQSRLSPGEALMAFVVPVSGQIKAESVSVLRASSNAHVAAGRGLISNCNWAPGRVGGIPVAVRVVALERFN